MCQQQICPSNARYAKNANYLMCIYQTTMWVYIPHMNSMQSIIWQKHWYVHFILLAHAPKQICLSNCQCISHWTSTAVYIQTPHYCTHQSKINKVQPLFTKLLQISTTNKFAIQMPYICQMPKLLNVHQWWKYVNLYMPHTNSLVLTMWPETLYTNADNDAGWWWWHHISIT